MLVGLKLGKPHLYFVIWPGEALEKEHKAGRSQDNLLFLLHLLCIAQEGASNTLLHCIPSPFVPELMAQPGRPAKVWVPALQSLCSKLLAFDNSSLLSSLIPNPRGCSCFLQLLFCALKCFSIPRHLFNQCLTLNSLCWNTSDSSFLIHVIK